MPEYVARQFLAAAELAGLRVEPRADGLWRVEHVPRALRSERLAAVRRLGPPEGSYRKLTFYKEHLSQDQHLDAILLGPGHPLYAAVDEVLGERLAGLAGGLAAFVDAQAAQPYRLHFLEMEIRGEEPPGSASSTLYAEVMAVCEESAATHLAGALQLTVPGRSVTGQAPPARPAGLSGAGTACRFSLVPADRLHDLAPLPSSLPPAADAATPFSSPKIGRGEGGPGDEVRAQAAIDFIRAGYQLEVRRRVGDERKHFVEIVRDYLTRSFEARIRAAENRAMSLRARELGGESDVALPAPGPAARRARPGRADPGSPGAPERPGAAGHHPAWPGASSGHLIGPAARDGPGRSTARRRARPGRPARQ